MADTRETAKDSVNSGMKKGPWVVKSGDRILGPYSTEALAQLIRDKEVVVIDEVMSPQGRWAYVRDVIQFASVVEEIRRGLMQAREDTEVQGYTSPVQKSSITRTAATDVVSENSVSEGGWLGAKDTKTGAANQLDDDDATVVTSSGPSSDAKPVAPTTQPTAPVVSLVPPMQAASQAVAKVQTPKPVMTPLPHHGREITNELPKQYVRPKVGGRKSGLVVGALVLTLAAGFVIYSVLKSPQISQSVVSADSLQTQASVAWKRGEFDRALELYRALNHQLPGNPIVSARLATLMMKIEGQTVEAKRVLDGAQGHASDDEQKTAVAIAMGLAGLQTEDLKTAVTQFSSAPNSWIASFDLGVAQSALKDWAQAAAAFTRAGENAASLLMLARTHLSAGEAGAAPKTNARHEAEEAIKKALNQSPDFQQESLLIAAYIDATAGNVKRANKEILDAVETDPNQTTDHFHDPGLSLDLLSWPKLLPYCQTLHKSLNTRVSGAMLGLCLAKANQIEDAMKVVEGEVSKDSNNAYLHAVNAYLHLLSDRDDAARASLTLSAKAGSSRLAQVLSARLCTREKQDVCAEEAWSKLASEANPPIAAITGLAQIREAKGDASTANALLVKADSMSPKYLPLLRLREDASR